MIFRLLRLIQPAEAEVGYDIGADVYKIAVQNGLRLLDRFGIILVFISFLHERSQFALLGIVRIILAASGIGIAQRGKVDGGGTPFGLRKQVVITCRDRDGYRTDRDKHDHSTKEALDDRYEFTASGH